MTSDSSEAGHILPRLAYLNTHWNQFSLSKEPKHVWFWAHTLQKAAELKPISYVVKGVK